MASRDVLPVQLESEPALLVAGIVAVVATLVIVPKMLRKLRGAGIVGRDINKPDRPEVPEMGGLAVFLGFNAGVFAFLVLTQVSPETEMVVLAALITGAGAAMTGILDDLVELRQRFKAFIPFVFAAPLALYLGDRTVAFPLVGTLDFGLAYTILLVPLGVACASNGFNMLEGYNGLGAGIGLVLATALGALAVLNGHPAALILLVPLAGALLVFLAFNRYPARVFPGDTMTLFVGAVLAAGAMLGKIEFWGFLLFIPHVAEFFLKMRRGFPSKGWWGEFRDGKLHCPSWGPVGIMQGIMRATGGIGERRLVAVILGGEVALAVVVVGAFVAAH